MIIAHVNGEDTPHVLAGYVHGEDHPHVVKEGQYTEEPPAILSTLCGRVVPDSSVLLLPIGRVDCEECLAQYVASRLVTDLGLVLR